MMPIVKSLLIVYSLLAVFSSGLHLRSVQAPIDVQMTNESNSGCPLDEKLCNSLAKTYDIQVKEVKDLMIMNTCNGQQVETVLKLRAKAAELLRQHLIIYSQENRIILSTPTQFIKEKLEMNQHRMDLFVRELKNGSLEALKKEMKKEYPALNVDDVKYHNYLENNQWVFNAAKVAMLKEIKMEIDQEIQFLDPNFCTSMHEKKKYKRNQKARDEYKELDQNKPVGELTDFATEVLKCFLLQRQDPQEIQQRNILLLKDMHSVLTDKSFDNKCDKTALEKEADIAKCIKTDDNRVAVSQFLESTKKLAYLLGKDVAEEESRKREAFGKTASQAAWRTIKATYDFGKCKLYDDCYVLAVANKKWKLVDPKTNIKHDGSHYAGHIHGLWYQKEDHPSIVLRPVPRRENIYRADAKRVAPTYSWAGTFLSRSPGAIDEQAQLMSYEWFKHGKKSNFGPTDYWNHAQHLLVMVRSNLVPSSWKYEGLADDKYCFKRIAAGWKPMRCA